MPFPPLPEEDLEHVLAHTRPLWEQFRGARIFVTGATGFFGIWLLESFAYANESLSLGSELVGLSRDPKAFEAKAQHLVDHPSISLIKGDVRDFEFPEGAFSHVIHAGTTSSSPVAPLEMLDTIIKGTRRTLDFAVASGAKRFLFVSSGAVYGKQPPEVTHLSETYQGAPDPMDQNSAYGEGKRVGELLCAIVHQEHGLDTTIARCFAFVGPHLPLDAHFAIGNFIRDAMKGDQIKVKNGTPYRSYLYAADLAIWLWTILFKGAACRPYNIGSDQEITIAHLAETVASTLGGSVLPSDSISNFNSPASRYVPSVKRALSEMDLNMKIPLRESLLRTASWHTSQR
ncbi:MAG: NAD-dependent epimerase/dehydratase family protein [Verrucomicrobia bacterium]|nr:NAD-dependent epimerase/dehydratase family protein [Verrucomicrobiota bacterium]